MSLLGHACFAACSRQGFTQGAPPTGPHKASVLWALHWAVLYQRHNPVSSAPVRKRPPPCCLALGKPTSKWYFGAGRTVKWDVPVSQQTVAPIWQLDPDLRKQIASWVNLSKNSVIQNDCACCVTGTRSILEYFFYNWRNFFPKIPLNTSPFE